MGKNKEALKYRSITISCFVGIFVQALNSNLTPLLFITLMNMYGLSYVHLGLLMGINFISQVSADLLLSGIIDKLGFRKLALPAIFFSGLGLVMFALSPSLFPSNIMTGFILSTILFSFAGGLLEILLSPIINAIPNDNKATAMTLMHSFYAWGQVATVIITTLCLFLIGKENWQYIALGWAVVPVIAFFMFYSSLYPPLLPISKQEKVRKTLFSPFYIIALLAIFFGGSTEVVMASWASSFMEKGLALSKVTGDLLGMCGFAAFMGLGRLIHSIFGEKMDMSRLIYISALTAFVCYLAAAFSPVSSIVIIAVIICGLASSLLWPGTLLLTAERYPFAGAWIFAILAAFGDSGAAIGNIFTGYAVSLSTDSKLSLFFSQWMDISSEQASLRIGILFSAIFPLMTFVTHYLLYKKGKSSQTDLR
ncbi:MAG: MFS transporter [Clostridia bacterium]